MNAQQNSLPTSVMLSQRLNRRKKSDDTKPTVLSLIGVHGTICLFGFRNLTWDEFHFIGRFLTAVLHLLQNRAD
jgi:hypothetical protein